MTQPLELDYPFTGRWRVRNSPANRIPSHGTTLFGLSYAIDFVPVDENGRSAPFTPGSFIRPEPPTTFVGFGRVITSPVDGEVVGLHDTEPDHDSYRGLPSVRYALTQRQRLRRGWLNVIGNHVLIETAISPGTRVVVALCHLQQASVAVKAGQSLRRGDRIGLCGNSGNSTEPHLHMHAVDGRDLIRANAVPITFEGSLPRNNAIVDAGLENP
ncbi:hypothetical protein GCM10022261_07360 [Brevibacterium daeguense]|uniref:M23ase beta-sheet core domain-containing protein n=1 Tax=Brevibacterium daeguense TaxID=909936 RepID=A0ABP8EGY1_9MICO|nr:M23 family metallopeptidase [Brevibacterium daeguense]